MECEDRGRGMSLDWIKFPVMLLKQDGIFRLLDADRKELPMKAHYKNDLRDEEHALEMVEDYLRYLNLPQDGHEVVPIEAVVVEEVPVTTEPTNASGNGDVHGYLKEEKRKGNPAFQKGKPNPYMKKGV